MHSIRAMHSDAATFLLLAAAGPVLILWLAIDSELLAPTGTPLDRLRGDEHYSALVPLTLVPVGLIATTVSWFAKTWWRNNTGAPLSRDVGVSSLRDRSSEPAVRSPAASSLAGDGCALGARIDGLDARRKRRAVDYLLEGESVRTNRHLARFAAARYLPWLLAEPAFDSLFNRQSKALRKESIEAFAVVSAMEELMASHGVEPPATIVDLCSGKGFLLMVLI